MLFLGIWQWQSCWPTRVGRLQEYWQGCVKASQNCAAIFFCQNTTEFSKSPDLSHTLTLKTQTLPTLTKKSPKSLSDKFCCLSGIVVVVAVSTLHQRNTSMVCVMGCLQSGQHRCWACLRPLRMSAQWRQRQRWRQGSSSTVLLRSWQMTHLFLSSCSFSRLSSSDFGRDVRLFPWVAGSFADSLTSRLVSPPCVGLVWTSSRPTPSSRMVCILRVLCRRAARTGSPWFSRSTMSKTHTAVMHKEQMSVWKTVKRTWLRPSTRSRSSWHGIHSSMEAPTTQLYRNVSRVSVNSSTVCIGSATISQTPAAAWRPFWVLMRTRLTIVLMK